MPRNVRSLFGVLSPIYREFSADARAQNTQRRETGDKKERDVYIYNRNVSAEVKKKNKKKRDRRETMQLRKEGYMDRYGYDRFISI